MRGIATVISNATGLDCRVADDPLTCVARGTALYLEHLAPRGVIAVHISNRHLDLRPVTEALARHFGLYYATLADDPDEEEWWLYPTTWVLLSRDPALLADEAIQRNADWPSEDHARLILWTDDRASLLGILK